jgi:predicted nucleic acid-binding protein
MPSDSIVFVDTNVLLYTFDDRDPVKKVQAQAWMAWCWHQRKGRISTQVLNEFYANALRKFSRTLPIPLARAEVQRLRAWQPWQIDDDTIDGAWALQDVASLSYWDALMVSAAQRIGCTHLLSEDMPHGQVIGGVQLINPFAGSPEAFTATP